MDVSESDLVERYQSMSSDELQNLYQTGGLTDIAISVIEKELSNRNVSYKENLKVEKDKIEVEIKKTEPEKLIKSIKSSTFAIYVIAVLQIITSLSFSFYPGVVLGLLLLILSYFIRVFKSSSVAIFVSVIGGLATITNIASPMLGGIKSGNTILSIIIIVLGIKLSKYCSSWVALKSEHNNTSKPMQ